MDCLCLSGSAAPNESRRARNHICNHCRVNNLRYNHICTRVPPPTAAFWALPGSGWGGLPASLSPVLIERIYVAWYRGLLETPRLASVLCFSTVFLMSVTDRPTKGR
jgi:hypothetical protein